MLAIVWLIQPRVSLTFLPLGTLLPQGHLVTPRARDHIVYFSESEIVKAKDKVAPAACPGADLQGVYAPTHVLACHWKDLGVLLGSLHPSPPVTARDTPCEDVTPHNATGAYVVVQQGVSLRATQTSADSPQHPRFESPASDKPLGTPSQDGRPVSPSPTGRSLQPLSPPPPGADKG